MTTVEKFIVSADFDVDKSGNSVKCEVTYSDKSKEYIKTKEGLARIHKQLAIQQQMARKK